jgi:aspartate dehydrogenase
MNGAAKMKGPLMSDMRIAIAGLGSIGRTLARSLADGVPGLALSCVAARDAEKARGWLDEEGIEVPIVALEEFPDHADLAVECAPAAIIEQICRPMLSAGKQVMVLSCGALLPRPELIELAKQHGGRIIVPTGGLLGLDAVAAAAEGIIHSVKMTTRKPPNGLAGAPHLIKHNISVEGLNEAKLVFSGTARDAAAGFPANVNVAAALALAGIGPDRTMIDIWADPSKTRNCHTIEVDSDSAAFTLSIENIPSENPKTGKIVALSVLATLRKLGAPLRVGT